MSSSFTKWANKTGRAFSRKTHADKHMAEAKMCVCGEKPVTRIVKVSTQRHIMGKKDYEKTFHLCKNCSDAAEDYFNILADHISE